MRDSDCTISHSHWRRCPTYKTIETGGINVHDLHKHFWINIVKFLEEGHNLSNEFSSFLAQVHPHAVVQLQHVAQVLHLANPGQRNTIQQDGEDILPIPDILRENEAFGFGFIWIDIGTKL